MPFMPLYPALANYRPFQAFAISRHDLQAIILLAMLFLGQPVLNAYLRGGSNIVNNFLSVLANGA